MTETQKTRGPLRHGHTRRTHPNGASPTYQSWMAMKARCSHRHRDPENKYVGRGIAYDPAWEFFDQFLSDMGERPEGMTLDRVNTNEGYSAANCRWATPAEQARNRRNAKLTFSTAVEVALRRLVLKEPCRDIAARYRCSESLVREVAKGRTWRDAHAVAVSALEAMEGR